MTTRPPTTSGDIDQEIERQAVALGVSIGRSARWIEETDTRNIERTSKRLLAVRESWNNSVAENPE